METNYSVLGLSNDASLQEVKSAYRSLAKKYHPDSGTSHSSSPKMVQLNVAYNNIIKNFNNPDFDEIEIDDDAIYSYEEYLDDIDIWDEDDLEEEYHEERIPLWKIFGTIYFFVHVIIYLIN